KGDRLVIDLTTGESRFENTGNPATGGRIRALFMPKQDAKSGDAKSGDAKPDDATAADAAPSSDQPDGASDAGDETPADSEPSDEVPWPLSPGARP
ncbi:MAG: hypothetical protein ACRECM_10375, partial [Methyloceanibacter sp.]